MPIVSNDRCKSMFLRAGRHEFIPDIFLCAGYETGGQDSCQVCTCVPIIEPLAIHVSKFPLRNFCVLPLRRATPEGLSRFAERTVDTFSLVSYPGASDARKPIYRASARGYPSSYRGS